MKILHLGKYFGSAFGGIERALAELAVSGTRMGAEVSCVVAKISRGDKPSEVVQGVQICRVPNLGEVFSAPMCPAYVFLDLSSYDVVHVHLPNPWAELAILKWLIFGKKRHQLLIPYLHSFPVNQKRLGRIWFALVTRRILNAADKIAVSSKRLVTESDFASGLDLGKLAQVPFAAKSLTQEEVNRASLSRKKSNLVLALGRLVQYKGFDVLIEAWARARQEAPKPFEKLELAIAGEGKLRAKLQRLIDERGVGDQVKLVGRISDQLKDDYFKRAILFVAPSANSAETFGISILEAMSYGLPVITTRLSTGVADLAREGDCGAVVDPGSVLDLAQALLRLVSDEGLRARAGAGNLEEARERYSHENLNRAYAKLVSSPANEGRRAA